VWLTKASEPRTFEVKRWLPSRRRFSASRAGIIPPDRAVPAADCKGTAGRGPAGSAPRHVVREATLAAPLEVLHGALVLLRGRTRPERTEVGALAGARIPLARIEAVTARAWAAGPGSLAGS